MDRVKEFPILTEEQKESILDSIAKGDFTERFELNESEGNYFDRISNKIRELVTMLEIIPEECRGNSPQASYNRMQYIHLKRAVNEAKNIVDKITGGD